MKRSPRHDLSHGRRITARTHVEIEYLFPHRREIDKVTLLPRVLLRDLHFHHLARLLESAEKRRHWLPRLKVDRTFLGLHNHVRRELAINWMKDVISRPRAVRLRITPIGVV